MKKKIREQITVLAKQLAEEEKTFKAACIKGLVGELYERLAVLEYLENQLEAPSEETVSESFDSKSFREENWFTEPEPLPQPEHKEELIEPLDRKSTRLNSSHVKISYAVFCLKKKNIIIR